MDSVQAVSPAVDGRAELDTWLAHSDDLDIPADR
jgi:hypothetical protein